MPDGGKISGISLYWVCVLLGRGGMQKLRRRNELSWSLQSAKYQCSVVFRAWAGYTDQSLFQCRSACICTNATGDNGHGAELYWDSSPDPGSTPWYWESHCITGSQSPTVDSCIERQKCCCLLGYTELCGWFLQWITAKWSEKMDMCPGYCDLFSVPHFLCSCVAKKYTGIECFNIGWVFLCVYWESYFLHLVKAQVPNTAGASRQKTYCCQGKECQEKRSSIQSFHVHPHLVWAWFKFSRIFPHWPLRLLFVIPSSWRCTLGRGSRSRSLTNTRETLKRSSRSFPATHLFYWGSWYSKPI